MYIVNQVMITKTDDWSYEYCEHRSFLAWKLYNAALSKLFSELDKRKISSIELTRMAGFSGNIMTRIRRNEYISMESLEAICKALDCTLDEIIEFCNVEENK